VRRALVLVLLAAASFGVTPGAARATFPGRNGEIVVCARYSGEPRGLFRIGADGGSLARVVPKATWEDIAPAWSPDGTTLAFVSERTGDRDIWTARPGSGDRPVNLTRTPRRQEWLPTWSSEGRLAFLTERSGGRSDTIDVIHANGGHRVTVVSRGADIFGVEWSPRGNHIAFGVQTGASFAIDSVRADGSGQMRWASGLRHAVVYDWRPDGRWVLFQGDLDGRRVLFEIATGGGHRIRRLTSPGPRESDQHAAYSPTGSKAVFVRTTPHGDELWLVRAGGGHERRLRALHRMRLFGVTWQPL